MVRVAGTASVDQEPICQVSCGPSWVVLLWGPNARAISRLSFPRFSSQTAMSAAVSWRSEHCRGLHRQAATIEPSSSWKTSWEQAQRGQRNQFELFGLGSKNGLNCSKSSSIRLCQTEAMAAKPRMPSSACQKSRLGRCIREWVYRSTRRKRREERSGVSDLRIGRIANCRLRIADCRTGISGFGFSGLCGVGMLDRLGGFAGGLAREQEPGFREPSGHGVSISGSLQFQRVRGKDLDGPWFLVVLERDQEFGSAEMAPGRNCAAFAYGLSLRTENVIRSSGRDLMLCAAPIDLDFLEEDFLYPADPVRAERILTLPAQRLEGVAVGGCEVVGVPSESESKSLPVEFPYRRGLGANPELL